MADTVIELEKRIKALEKSQAQAQNLLEEKTKEFHHLNKDLREQFEKRTLELEKSRDEAIQATKSKDRFLARMSHEIRTPLNGIIGVLDLLKKTSLTEEQRNFIDISSESGVILLSIINDILEYSKITAGKTQLEIQDFNLENSIESVAEILSYKVLDKGLDFILDIDEGCPALFRSDEQKIRQILINLIGNSIKFTPSGEIRVSVSPTPHGIEISVTDTGIGVPQDKISSIFKSFTQADAKDTRKYGGSGLGLAICKHFTQLLGGDISATSKEGVGTTFCFSLLNHLDEFQPIHRPNLKGNLHFAVGNRTLEELILKKMNHWKVKNLSFQTLEELESSFSHKPTHVLVDYPLISEDWVPPSGSHVSVIANHGEGKALKEKHSSLRMISPPLSNSKLLSLFEEPTRKENRVHKLDLNKRYQTEEAILLVEDNLINQKVAVHMLKAAGLNCEIANNGQEAVDMVSRKFYRIIFMDFNMPVMDGVEATKMIRDLQQEAEKKSHIIAMTASAMKETREICAEAGMDDFVTKPVKLDDLTYRIQRIFAQNRKTAS